MQPELDDDRALVGQRALEGVDLARRRGATPPRSAKPSTRSTSTRPYQERSKTLIPPQPGSAGQKRPRKWWRFSSSVGAANWATRTWRGSSGATRRLIAPPLPEASQPSKTTLSGGPSRHSPISPPSVSRSCASRSPGSLQLAFFLLAAERRASGRPRRGVPPPEPTRRSSFYRHIRPKDERRPIRRCRRAIPRSAAGGSSVVRLAEKREEQGAEEDQDDPGGDQPAGPRQVAEDADREARPASARCRGRAVREQRGERRQRGRARAGDYHRRPWQKAPSQR